MEEKMTPPVFEMCCTIGLSCKFKMNLCNVLSLLTCRLNVVSTFLQHVDESHIDKKAQLSLTNPCDAVEIQIIGHSRALKVTPFVSIR